MTGLATYAALFTAAFMAATILPMQSEAALVGLILTDSYSVALLVLVASLGNIAGSLVNWALGRGAVHFQDRSWFPAKPEQLARAARWYHRYGRWSLLLSWVPILGDPLTVVAGILREPLWSFLLLVSLAKTGRYLVLTAAVT